MPGTEGSRPGTASRPAPLGVWPRHPEAGAVSLVADLLTRLPAAVAYLAGPQHVFELTNDAYQRLVAGRDVLGKPVREALPEVEGQGYFELLDRVFRTGEAVTRQSAEVWLRGDGVPEKQQAFVDFSYQPVRDGGGRVVGILVHAADVTAHVLGRRRLEGLTAELAAAEERYRTLFETMPQGVVYQDADGTIVAMNPAATAILGADAAELTGRRSDDPRWRAVRADGSPFPGEQHPAMVVLRTGRIVSDVVMGVVHGRSGERRWISVTGVPDAFDAQRRPRRVYTMFSDVTEQRRATATLHERDSFLGRLRDANVLGIIVADEERVLDANDALLAMVGHDRADLEAGRINWREMTPAEWSARDDAAIEQLRRTGSCRPFEKEYFHASGRRVPILIGAAVIDRDPLRWVTFIVDLSERQRAEQERAELLAAAAVARAEAESAETGLGLLLRAGALVTATRNREELLEHTTRLLVPALADVALVLLPSREGLRPTALQHREPAGAAPPAGLAPLDADGRGGLHVPYATGQSQLLRDLGLGLPPPTRLHPWTAAAAAQLRVDSLVAVPLAIGARRLGVLALGRGDERPPFTELDVAVVEELGRRLAVGLTNADVFAREHGVSEILQRALLPDTLPSPDGVDLAVRYLPATVGVDVGGDWYDAFPLPGDRLGLVVGDVVGHNLASASVMGQIRTILRAYAVDSPDPAHVLDRTNAALDRLLPDAMATALYAVLDPCTGELAYAAAGHPPPLLSDGDGTVRYLDAPGGRMLGATDDGRYLTHGATLPPGGTLLLYTDGLVEDRRRPIDDGLDALAAAAAAAPAVDPETLCTGVLDALLPWPSRDDDVCVLAARLAAGGRPGERNENFPSGAVRKEAPGGENTP